jgi:hypothetical protein
MWLLIKAYKKKIAQLMVKEKQRKKLKSANYCGSTRNALKWER